MKARRTQIDIIYDGVSIAADIAPYLLGLSYTDNLSGEADDLRIDLHDRDGIWSTDWRPQTGDLIEAAVTCEPWVSEERVLSVGKFYIDSIEYSGPPKKAAIRATSAPMVSRLRREKRTRAWAGFTLQGIALDIANRAELGLLYIGPEVRLERKDQRETSDLSFLLTTAEDEGWSVKVTDGQIAVFREQDLERETPTVTLTPGISNVIRWDFRQDSSELYASCTVRYFDEQAGTVQRATVQAPDVFDGPVLERHSSVRSIAEAESVATALLRQANAQASSGRVTLVGDPALVSGITIGLSNAYGFDGVWLVTRSTHRFTNGYQVDLELRRTLEGYP